MQKLSCAFQLQPWGDASRVVWTGRLYCSTRGGMTQLLRVVGGGVVILRGVRSAGITGPVHESARQYLSPFGCSRCWWLL